MNQYSFSQCKYELGCEALVKTQDESLTIIQDAKGLFFGMESSPCDGIERIEGIDVNRGVCYQIIAGGGFMTRVSIQVKSSLCARGKT